MMTQIWKALLLLLVATGCSPTPQPSPAEPSTACPVGQGLIGGAVSAACQFPATAGLLVKSGEDDVYLTCTMTKVGPRTFVVAAHCFFREGAQDGAQPVRPELSKGADIGVLFGVHQPKEGVEPSGSVTRTVVEDIRIHPTWYSAVSPEVPKTEEGAKDGDAALLRVRDMTPEIDVATIDTLPIEVDTRVVMTGYGCTTHDHGSTGPLRFLDASIEAVFGSMLYTSSTPTKAPENGGICPGDSGGGLFREGSGQRVLSGVNSRFVSSEVLGRQTGPNESYFTRLDDSGPLAMGTWLRQNLAELEP